MTDFTAIYLDGLREGISKKASVMGFRPFAPENAPITGGVAGAAIGGATGALGNAMFGSSEIDPRTGKKRNGVLARLAKGGLVGAGLGGAGGAMAGPVANDALSQLITNDNTPLHTGVAQSLTVSDLISGAAGQDLSPQRRMGLGVEGLIRGGDEMIDSFFPR